MSLSPITNQINPEVVRMFWNSIFQLNMTRGSEGVAQSLRSFGVKGTPGSPAQCPLACYFKEIGGVKTSVGGSIIISDDDDNTLTLKTPQVLANFISDFDSYVYKDLVKPSAYMLRERGAKLV